MLVVGQILTSSHIRSCLLIVIQQPYGAHSPIVSVPDIYGIPTPQRAMLNFCVRRRPNGLIVTAVLSTWLLLLPFSQTQTVTISDENNYKNLRKCAQPCVTDSIGTDLFNVLSCASPYQNSCLCREDLAPIVSSWLSKCINSGCTPATVDIAQAISVYGDYCTRNVPNSNVALTTLDSSSPTTTVVAITTVTSGGSNSPASGSLQMLTAALVLAVATIVLSPP
jgi:hypothetical protein